jgi:hypothetical protein
MRAEVRGGQTRRMLGIREIPGAKTGSHEGRDLLLIRDLVG